MEESTYRSAILSRENCMKLKLGSNQEIVQHQKVEQTYMELRIRILELSADCTNCSARN